jgi:hypothetical protein
MTAVLCGRIDLPHLLSQLSGRVPVALAA